MSTISIVYAGQDTQFPREVKADIEALEALITAQAALIAALTLRVEALEALA